MEENYKAQAAIQQKLAAMFSANKDEVSIPKIYIDMTNDIEAAAVLDELLFWTLPKKGTGKTSLRVFKRGGLWLAVRRKDWWERKRLTERQADGAIKKLISLDLIEKDVFLFDGKPTVHLRMNMTNFVKTYGDKMQELAAAEDDENLTKDIADLYSMMGFPNQTVNSNLPNGEMLNLPNGEFINSPVQPEYNIQSFSKPAKTDEEQGKYHTAYNRGEQERPDAVGEYLKMAQSPAVKREREIDDLLSKWAVNFVVNTTSKDWRQFAEYAVDMHTKEGWNPIVFIQWVQSQDGWPNFWSRKRMQENYPKAYAGKIEQERPELKKYEAHDDTQFIPRPK